MVPVAVNYQTSIVPATTRGTITSDTVDERHDQQQSPLLTPLWLSRTRPPLATQPQAPATAAAALSSRPAPPSPRPSPTSPGPSSGLSLNLSISSLAKRAPVASTSQDGCESSGSRHPESAQRSKRLALSQGSLGYCHCHSSCPQVHGRHHPPRSKASCRHHLQGVTIRISTPPPSSLSHQHHPERRTVSGGVPSTVPERGRHTVGPPSDPSRGSSTRRKFSQGAMGRGPWMVTATVFTAMGRWPGWPGGGYTPRSPVQ